MTTISVPRETPAPSARIGEESFRGIQRRLAARFPNESWVEAPPALELSALGAQDAPRLLAASLLEGRELRAHRVQGAVEPRFAAFLDGTQSSRVVTHVDAVPIVYGAMAAVIRRRVDRRMRTWSTPRAKRALYAPTALLPAPWRAALEAVPVAVVDTMAQRQVESPHPFALQDAAIHAVQDDRETLERELGERWCAETSDMLFVDGAISGSERMATASCVVGVVKSHHTLYAEGEALRVVLRLQRGERSSVLRITSPRRTPVASWYLRLRDPAGHDPLWGLVRVEVAEPNGASSRELAARADEVSRWVMAEILPLAVPDGRWDKMVYGIRDCEEFLRAIR